jgi:hypothetical protein
VLYLATDPETALAEVRAWKGAVVAIATVQLARTQRLIDLTRSLGTDQPFFVEAWQLSWRLELSDALSRFATELSRPVLPGEDIHLYRVSQRLTELIRGAGYDGLVYPSAMGSGSNIVLFDPTAAPPIDVRYVRVTEVVHNSIDLVDGGAPYGGLPYGDLLPPPEN